MNGRSPLARFLHTDPRDVGCAEAMELLRVRSSSSQPESMPKNAPRESPPTSRACGPCTDDFKGLLAAVVGSAG